MLDMTIRLSIGTVRIRASFSGILTIATIYRGNNRVATGVATLHPKDEHNEIYGEKVALSRALEVLSHADRKLVWEKYLKERGVAPSRGKRVFVSEINHVNLSTKSPLYLVNLSHICDVEKALRYVTDFCIVRRLPNTEELLYIAEPYNYLKSEGLNSLSDELNRSLEKMAESGLQATIAAVP